MKYAVIQLQGSQYKVKEGDEIEVNYLSDKKANTLKPEVLLYVNDKVTKIGNPVVENAAIKYKILKHYLGEKLHVFKFKAKTGYRRKIGFRPKKTLVKIEEISLS